MNGSQGGACARLRLAPARRPTGTTDRQRHTQSHAVDALKHVNYAVSDISAGRPKAVQTTGSTSDDPLHRGDDAERVRNPDPAGNPSLVRHILGLDGIGRSTPYVSTTEDEETAKFFAGREGRVWYTLHAKIEATGGLRYISNGELRDLLRGKGKGNAAWPTAFEVRQAFKFVEEHAEHLIDFRGLAGQAPERVGAVVAAVFSKSRP